MRESGRITRGDAARLSGFLANRQPHPEMRDAGRDHVGDDRSA
jgi:hypothetical protein